MLEKRKPYRNDKIRKSAEGEECLMRSPYCSGDTRETVLVHLDMLEFGKGTGQKADDCAGFYGCKSCHDWYAGLLNTGHTREFRDELALRAVIRTTRRLIDKGVLK